MTIWILAALLACNTAAPTSDELRLVSLQPQITETLFAIGAGEFLVGRSDYDTLPAQVLELPATGTALTPNLEAVVGLNPSHVLIEQTYGARTDLLEPLATVESFPWQQVDDLAPSIRRLGVLTDREEQAEQVLTDLLSAVSTAPPGTGVRVLMVYAADDLGTAALWFVQRNSLHGAALHAAGFINAVDEDITGAPSMPIEQLLAVNPDVIVILSADDALTPDGTHQLTHAFDALTPLSAAQGGNVVVLASSRSHSTGPELATFAPLLREAVAKTLLR